MPYLPYSAKKDKHGKFKWELHHKVCIKCQEDFKTRIPHQRFCSTKCRRSEAGKRKRYKTNK